MVTWDAGRVSTSDSIEVHRPVTSAGLRDAYVESVRALTLGLVRVVDNSVRIGPIELLRFGEPRLGRSSVQWPIEGGLLAGGRGGTWRIESKRGVVEASVGGYRPALPRPLYDVTHLQVHQLFAHLFLLRVRGAEPAPGIRASREDSVRAAAVDIAFCLTIAGTTGSRRPRRTLLVAAAYHVACWSLAGRTMGGLVMRQRVVSLDGTRPTATQSLLRFVLLPVSWLAGRPVHDEITGTLVIRD